MSSLLTEVDKAPDLNIVFTGAGALVAAVS